MSLLTNLKKRAKQLKSEAQVLMIAYKDKRTPASAKILIGITVGYLLSLIDLIYSDKALLAIAVSKKST